MTKILPFDINTQHTRMTKHIMLDPLVTHATRAKG